MTARTGTAAAPKATVALVPRETFSATQRTLDNMIASTDPPFRLVCVDGGSPPPVRDWLAQQARTHDFTLLRTDHLLAPNEARNMVMEHVDTEFVAFVDNDCLVPSGWLGGLVACAEETGASIVAPLYLIGDPASGHVHAAGSVCQIVDRDGRRHFEEYPLELDARLADLGGSLHRRETGSSEFHCVLIRTATLRATGPFDEELLSDRDHGDLALRVREQGGSIWLEPQVVVAYAPPRRLTAADREFFLLRWSEQWNRRSAERFRQKWALADDDPSFEQGIRWTRNHRFLAWPRYRSPWRRLANIRGTVYRPLPDRLLEPRVVRRAERDRARAKPVVTVHTASWAGPRGAVGAS